MIFMDNYSKDFNKEIIIGELGALAGAIFFGCLALALDTNLNFTSIFTVLGSVTGGSYSWLITRIYDQKKRGEFSIKNLGKDISLYTPLAFLTVLLICYPIVFFVTRSVSGAHFPFLGPVAGELSGFAVFLILMNSYRYVLKNSFNKNL